MKKELTVGFRVSLYEVMNPRELWSKLKPEKCKDSVWVPQTLGDQIWMWFEFENLEEKNEYLDSLKEIEIVNEYDYIDQNGVQTHKIEKAVFKPKNNFMLDNFSQEKINHWTGGV